MGLGLYRTFLTGTTLIGPNRMTTLKKWLKEWGLESCRSQAHTFESISGPVGELWKQFPTAGAAAMRDHLRLRSGIRVPRCASVFASPYSLANDRQRKLILDYNKATDPAGVLARKAGRIRRRVFYAAGVNHVWAFDQHDKWQRFGLRLHLGIEPFSGLLLWLIVWWTNSNPKLVGREYFRTARKYGGMLLLISGKCNKVTLGKKESPC